MVSSLPISHPTLFESLWLAVTERQSILCLNGARGKILITLYMRREEAALESSHGPLLLQCCVGKQGEVGVTAGQYQAIGLCGMSRKKSVVIHHEHQSCYLS